MTETAVAPSRPVGPDQQGRRRRGRTICLEDVWITGAASIAGRTEGQGPMGERFDEIVPDHLLGQKSWERAESALLERAFHRLCNRLKLKGKSVV